MANADAVAAARPRVVRGLYSSVAYNGVGLAGWCDPKVVGNVIYVRTVVLLLCAASCYFVLLLLLLLLMMMMIMMMVVVVVVVVSQRETNI